MASGSKADRTSTIDAPNEVVGPWDPALAKLSEWDPAWAETCVKMTTNPWRSAILPRRLIELIGVALNAACTNLNPEGTRRHIRAALRAGATRDEILLALKMASLLSIHSCSLGAPILLEEAKEAGLPPMPAPAAEFAVLFIVFHVADEVVVGLFKERTLTNSVPAIGGGGLAGQSCVSVILFIALIPFFAFRQISRVLGADRLNAMLFGPPVKPSDRSTSPNCQTTLHRSPTAAGRPSAELITPR